MIFHTCVDHNLRNSNLIVRSKGQSRIQILNSALFLHDSSNLFNMITLRYVLPVTKDEPIFRFLYARLVGMYYGMAWASFWASLCLSVHKHVNTIQTKPFQLGQSNLVHILLMTRGRHLFIFKVRGQRSKARHCCKTL